MARITSGWRAGDLSSALGSGGKDSCSEAERPVSFSTGSEAKERDWMLGEGVGRGDTLDAESETAGVRGEGLSSEELTLCSLLFA